MTAPVPFELTAQPGHITKLTIDGTPVEVTAVRFEQADGEIGHLTIARPSGAATIGGLAHVIEAADQAEIIVEFLQGVDAEQLAAAALNTLHNQTLASRILELLIDEASRP